MNFMREIYDNISIRLLPNGVSFFIQSKDGKVLLSDKIEQTSLPSSEAIQEAILLSGILEKSCKNIKIIVPTPLFTLLPEDVFEVGVIDEYYRASVGDLSGKKLIYQHLEEMELYLIFAVDEALYDFLLRSFVSFETEHHLSPLLTRLNAKLPHLSHCTMYVSYETQLLSIILFKEGAFFSANTFNCSSTEDALYYTLSTWKQLKCDQENDELYIIEGDDFQESLLRKLTPYIKQATFLLTNKEVS